MLIPFKYMPKKSIKGIVHIGAHEAEELSDYSGAGIVDVLWVEANPLKWPLLADKIAPFSSMKLGRFAAGAKSNQTAVLHVADNGQSSSLLEFGTHRDSYPGINFVDDISVPMRSVDDWIDEVGANRAAYNFVNLDIQGYELEALRGMIKQLDHVDYVYTEINTSDVYKNCAHVADLDDFLATFGFQRVATEETNQGWGDALYARSGKLFLTVKFRLLKFALNVRRRLAARLK